MLHLIFPIGSRSGWDICGKYLAIEISKLTDISLVTSSPITFDQIGDELEYCSISRLPINSIDEDYFDRTQNLLKGVSLRTLNDLDLSIWLGDIRSEITIGYTFYLGSPLTELQKASAKNLNIIIAGSSFSEVQLNNAGIENTRTIIQGINPQLFNPSSNLKSLFNDRFVIFSGGKFEFRKGQDIVLRAFKIFSDRHSDAILVNSWVNQWDFSLNTMFASCLIDFCFDSKDYVGSMNRLYQLNGIDPEKVITLSIKPSHLLSYIFKNSDIGLFPNRCEGGTNLMLMEYMACGKPVIATSKTGHSDIVREENSFSLKNYGPVSTRGDHSSEYPGWVEPDIEEILDHLETAYNDPDLCKKKGEAAGESLSELTWQKSALEFYQTTREFL